MKKYKKKNIKIKIERLKLKILKKSNEIWI